MIINVSFYKTILVAVCFLLLIGCSQNVPSQPDISQPDANSAPQVNDNEQPPDTEEISQAPTVEEIETSWQNSPHAITFVVDDEGQNNSCAQCHAPTDWQPSMDDIPESCFSCKFELEDPPSYINEQDWNDIPCYVCHEVDKRDEVQPEIAWLEIAAIGEYAEVESSDQLCNKCHWFSDPFEGHSAIINSGVHQDQACTACHDPHTTTASCIDCHNELDFTTGEIPGHDQSHADIPCAVCHDRSGLLANLDAENGQWQLADQSDDGLTGTIVSHNLSLEAPCSRCHYADNPWSLSVQP